jgi:hypothetical protein
VDGLFAFTAALLALRLAGALLRGGRTPERIAWAASLGAYAVAAAAVAWGASAGWDGRAFRVYYLFGGLLTAPLLGIGSLLLVGRRWAAPLGLVYAGLATGIAVTMPVHGAFGPGVPGAQAHLDFVPARLAAVLGNSLGTVAVVAVALLTLRRRPLGNGLILAGVATAAVGSAFGGLGAAGIAISIAAAAVLLYAGFVGQLPSGWRETVGKSSASFVRARRLSE